MRKVPSGETSFAGVVPALMRSGWIVEAGSDNTAWAWLYCVLIRIIIILCINTDNTAAGRGGVVIVIKTHHDPINSSVRRPPPPIEGVADPAAHPVLQRLLGFPRVRGHVVGALRECSRDVHALLPASRDSCRRRCPRVAGVWCGLT